MEEFKSFVQNKLHKIFNQEPKLENLIYLSNGGISFRFSIPFLYNDFEIKYDSEKNYSWSVKVPCCGTSSVKTFKECIDILIKETKKIQQELLKYDLSDR